MNIYTDYVFPDKLISPINGYQCKVVTKQNIEQFGFASTEELLNKFPEFPLCCDSLKENRRNNYFNPNPVRYDREKLKYYENPKLCRECSKILGYYEKHKVFCNKSCAATFNNRTMSLDARKKQANTLKINNAKRRKQYTIIEKNCQVCGKAFLSKHAKSCSTDCKKILLSAAGRKSANSRIVRSKDEIKLFNLCSAVFECLNNYIISDGWDADIVIPSHKIAILWNGPWHYKEMNIKNHSLLQVQNRDKIKKDLFEKLGWRVMVFEDRLYTPETAFNEILELVAGAGFEPA